MKIGIDRGHNSDKDMGASGIRLEGTMINEVAYSLIELLKSVGHTVVDITGNGRNLRDRTAYANTLDLDMIVSIHFNASTGAGHGVEVLYKSSKGKALAEPILRAIVALGFTDRGVKLRTDLYILNQTKAPTVLVEGCFCDSKVDMALYNKDKLINAIFKGITGKDAPVKVTVPAMYSALVLKVGSKGDAVKFIQKIVGAVADGNFGLITKLKVIAYQKAKGLVADGIVGKATWNSIK